MKLEKVYTKTGDKGQTSLYSGQRVDKTSPRIKLVGKVDTVNAQLGVAKVYSNSPFGVECIEAIQNILISEVMAMIAYDGKYPHELFFNEKLQKIYDEIVSRNSEIELNGWVSYGSTTKAAAFLDLATTYTREVEILYLETAEQLNKESFRTPLNPDLKVFFNMLSKILYLLARVEL